MLSILGWMIFGLIVGALAKLVMPGRDPGGIVVTMLLGVVGALVAGFLGRALGWYRPVKLPASSWRPSAPSWSWSSTGRSQHGGPRFRRSQATGQARTYRRRPLCRRRADASS